MAETCVICKRNVLDAYARDKAGAYCSRECYEVRTHPGFCDACKAETEPRGPGNLGTVNTIGTRFLGRGRPCPTCHSIVRRVWFCVLFVPFVPLKAYRVITFGGGRYLARTLKR